MPLPSSQPPTMPRHKCKGDRVTTEQFFVPGTPRPQGSKKYAGHRGGKPILLESSVHLKDWRTKVRQVAQLHHRGPQWDGPIHVETEFIIPRPKNWKPNRMEPCTVKPDGDKLTRAIWDALTGIVFRDDSQIVKWSGTKRRAQHNEQPGVSITITAR